MLGARGAGTRPVPDGAADAATPGTERAPSHFLLGIQNAKPDTGGPRPSGETLLCGPLRAGYDSQTRLGKQFAASGTHTGAQLNKEKSLYRLCH